MTADAQVIFQVSLVAAYVAGIVALFAPCCISYLFPAYIGSIFKEKKQILLMTLVYSLGIFAVMLPVVLGAKALSNFFFRYHDLTYLVGGGVMMVVAFVALLGIKLPMLHFSVRQKSKPDISSSFALGVVSGITSACCAPVLLGVLALSSFSTSMLQALAIGIVYVLGMVSPLYLAAVLIRRKNIMDKPILKKHLTTLVIAGRSFPIFVTNVVASAVFFFTGLIMILLTITGKVSMSMSEDGTAQLIKDIAFKITEWSEVIPGANLFFAVLLVIVGYKIYKEMRYDEKGQISENNRLTEDKSVSECCTTKDKDGA
jgi:cytochrome c-type biogenesis protein